MRDDMPRPERAVERRALLRASAWAVPVIVLTTATPAAAANSPQGSYSFSAASGLSADGTRVELTVTLTTTRPLATQAVVTLSPGTGETASWGDASGWSHGRSPSGDTFTSLVSTSSQAFTGSVSVAALNAAPVTLVATLNDSRLQGRALLLRVNPDGTLT
ncbi:hypothetical protein N3K63_10245 [Microbacterium sp. W1N]|uniref:hypothetical protein n=1 Tax=Microbacterium festucae TaxID=2977531 RepID=UPI0021BF157A|nr:hypothetical protein [Microbacterium festucae]MCT9820661.1 hypothetical protein [Microbacterium festucae]